MVYDEVFYIYQLFKILFELYVCCVGRYWGLFLFIFGMCDEMCLVW